MKKKILAGILSFVMLVTCVFVGSACDEKKESAQTNVGKEQMVDKNLANTFSTEFVNGKGIKLMAATPMTVSTTTNTVSQTLQATVYPTTATNKAVDWTVAWTDSSKTEDVKNYVTVSPQSNGSTTATVTCYQAFEGNIIVTVTTRESGYTADCIVTFVGVPTEIKVTSDLTEQTDGYHLGIGSAYAFNVALDNPFHSIGADYQNVTATLNGVGSLILSYKEYYISSGTENWFDTSDKEVTLESLKNKFITISYANGILTVNTLKSIESYYESVDTMDGGRTKAYDNIFRSYVTDCYFTVKLTESNSGLSKIIKIRFDDTVVAGVGVADTEMKF